MLGILLIAFGSIGAASFYVHFRKVKGWAWESYWLSMAVSVWLILPVQFALGQSLLLGIFTALAGIPIVAYAGILKNKNLKWVYEAGLIK